MLISVRLNLYMKRDRGMRNVEDLGFHAYSQHNKCLIGINDDAAPDWFEEFRFEVTT